MRAGGMDGRELRKEVTDASSTPSAHRSLSNPFPIADVGAIQGGPLRKGTPRTE